MYSNTILQIGQYQNVPSILSTQIGTGTATSPHGGKQDFIGGLEVKPPNLEKQKMNSVFTEHEADVMEALLFVSAFPRSSVSSSSHMTLVEREKHK